MGDQELNSLERFKKKSERLLLEQYGSCEVPAGCGGVVLRWRNPADGRPMVFSAVLYGNIDLFVDGRPSVGGCLIIPPGDHVVAAHFFEVARKSGPLLFYARDDTAARRSADREYLLKSAADGTWLATTTTPTHDDWMFPEYDDSNWPALAEARNFDPERLDSNWKWRYKGRMEDGVVPLALPECNQFWLRKRFHLNPEE